MSSTPVTIKHSTSGACATVHPFGATVTSFVTSKGHECLFVSKLAKTDGSKPIRGGIPLVFPQFGQPSKDMPQHGFLRRNVWTVAKKYDNDEEAACEFTLALKDVVNARGDGKWSTASENTQINCFLSLVVKVASKRLTSVLKIINTGQVTFEYQTLFHTYFKIHGAKALDKTLCNVVGLDRYIVYDKIAGDSNIQDKDPLFVDGEVDRIYTAPQDKSTVDVCICTGSDGSRLNVKAFAINGKDVIPVSAVVWNPFILKSKGMGDFDDDEYNDMICVEPGILQENLLRPQNESIFTQIIEML